MVPVHPGVSPEDHDPDLEETLVRYDLYIVALVKQGARNRSNFAQPGELDLEVDEMVQRVRIKFWQALAEKHIEHPKAYLRTMVRNEFYDRSRKHRPLLPLPIDDEGEWYIADEAELEKAWAIDPADEFEESESVAELMDSTVDAIAKLAPRQQQAMICELHEKIDSTLLLIQTLWEHRVAVKTVDWPENEVEKVLLRASLSPARHKMAQNLGFDLYAHRKKP